MKHVPNIYQHSGNQFPLWTHQIPSIFCHKLSSLGMEGKRGTVTTIGTDHWQHCHMLLWETDWWPPGPSHGTGVSCLARGWRSEVPSLIDIVLMCHSTPTLSSHYTVGQYGGRPVTFNNLLTPQFVMNEGRDKLTRSPQMWVVTAGSPTVPQWTGNCVGFMWINRSQDYTQTKVPG